MMLKYSDCSHSVLLVIPNLQSKSISIVNKAMLKLQKVEFTNSVDPNEVAHQEPSQLDLQYLPLVFEFSK